jgi:uncharacterized protein
MLLSASLLFVDLSSKKCGTLELKKICLETVTTPEAKQIGMSKYSTYSCGKGMLFDFGETSSHGIWMKNMKFPLDIAWLDADRKIIKVEKNVQPETYPQSFGEDVRSSYVLETFPGCYNMTLGSILTL